MDEVIIGLVGIIIGWLLNEVSRWIHERNTKRGQAEAIRTAFLYEIQVNMQKLDVVNQAKNLDTDFGYDEEEKHNTLFEFLGDWEVSIWNSQLPNIPSILTPQEVRALVKFYTTITLFKSMYKLEPYTFLPIAKRTENILNSNLPKNKQIAISYGQLMEQPAIEPEVVTTPAKSPDIPETHN